MAKLAKQFVCVRIQSMNGVDLNRFAFDYDLTWMAFFQDAKGRSYTRYGGRDDAHPESHLSKESLMWTMRQVLEMHDDGRVQTANNKDLPKGPSTTPERLPAMAAIMAPRKESCIHCHDVKGAQLRHLREQGQLKKQMVYTYPAPGLLGIELDGTRQHLVAAVRADSIAARGGLQAGDVIQTANGLSITTFADLTRALHVAPAEGQVPVRVKRDGVEQTLTLDLPAGWKVSAEPSWRASLHVVGPGAGFWGRPANAAERRKLGLSADQLALKVTFIWAKHAKAAGVKLNDVIVDLDGNRKNMTMRQCHAFLHLNREWQQQIQLVALRGKRRVTLDMRLPKPGVGE